MGTSATDIVPDSPDEINEKKTDADLAVLSHDEGAIATPDPADEKPRRKSVALNIIENPLTVSSQFSGPALNHHRPSFSRALALILFLPSAARPRRTLQMPAPLPRRPA
jgi:hypothetical protein